MNRQAQTKWLKISLDCPELILEAISDLMGVLSGSGVEQTPVANGSSTVSGFFRLDRKKSREEIVDELCRETEALFQLYSLAPPAPAWTTLNDEDWATSWQQFFKPFAIIPGLVIKPSWEKYTPGPNEQIIVMDPGMAFGTGQHASTRLALGLIHTCFQVNPPETVLDVGTGTGILAMAAVLFGAGKVVAIDNDPEAVRVAHENITNNNLQQTISTSATSLAELTGTFDLICANIVHDVLVEMAPTIAGLLIPGGRLVLAGILQGTQEKNIISVYQKLHISLVRSTREDEWISLLMRAA